MYSSSHSMKPFLITWAAYLAVMWLIPAVFLSRYHIPEKADFGCFYAAGLIARTDAPHLYDLTTQLKTQIHTVGPENGWTVFIQPPYEALPFMLLSLLPYKTAYLLYLVLNVALIIPCFLLARDEFSHFVDPWQPRPGLLFFFFFPLLLALLQGQGSVRLLFFCCAAWYELERARDFSAGLLLALALFKFQVIIPLAVLLTVWRGIRLLAGFLAGTALVLGVSFWIVGMHGMSAFGRLLLSSSLVIHQQPTDIPDVGLTPIVMPNLRGLLYGGGGKDLPHNWLLVLTLTASVILLFWAAYLIRRQHDNASGFALAITAALLLSYYLHPHDLTPLLLVIGLLSCRPRPYFTALVAACFILPVVLQFRYGQPHYIMAIPLLGFMLLVACRPAVSGSAASQLEPTGQ